MGLVCVVAAAFLALVWLTSVALGRPFGYVSREPATVLGGAWYAGFLSNVGALLWTIAATASLLTWWVQRRRAGAGANLLLWAGLLTAAELLDDLFLLHDAVYPMLGVPEQAVFASYGLATLTLAGVFRERLGRAGVVAVGSTLVLFGASFAVDQAWSGNQLFEDSFKFLGIAVWTSYLVVLSAAELRAEWAPGREPTDDSEPASGVSAE